MLPTSRRIASNYWNTRRCGKSTGKKGEEKIASPRKFKLRKKREGKKISKKIYNETYIFTCLFPDVIIYPFILSFSLSLLLFLAQQARSKSNLQYNYYFPNVSTIETQCETITASQH